MENFKMIEREERVNKAKRNLMLAESLFEDAKRDYEKLNEMKEEHQHDVHFLSNWGKMKRKMSRAYDDVLSAKQALSIAELDPSILEKSAESLTWGFT